MERGERKRFRAMKHVLTALLQLAGERPHSIIA